MRSGLLRVVATLALALSFVVLQSAEGQRRVSEEALLFRQVRDGVVTVFGEEGTGTGFLVDTLGLILTNDHVVGTSRRIRVKFDDSTRVEARLLAREPKRDVAVIWVSPAIAARYPVLKLASPSDTMVFEGEKVIAVGSPLHQEKIMTSGIVSKVEPTAIISDVNLNPGNSGGPLINMNGEAIAINTFLDFDPQRGPGTSGSVVISEAAGVLSAARDSTSGGAAPSDRLLPVAPKEPFPLEPLQAIAEYKKFKERPYQVSKSVNTGKFEVEVITPIYDTWRTHQVELQLAKHMKKREQKGGAQASQSSEPLQQMRGWMRYTGDSYAPLVTIQMTPAHGQTAGSIFGNILGAAFSGAAGTGYRGNYRYEFKADFKDVRVLRNSEPVEDIMIARQTIPLLFATSDWSANYSGEDLARAGIFQCTSDWFAPDSTGQFPTIHVSITSVERPNQPYEFDLPKETVQQVWQDFAAYRTVLESKAR